MISTKKVKLSPRTLFSILLIRYFRRLWWLFVGLWVFAIYFLFMDQPNSFDTFLIVFAIAYPLLIILQFWRYVNSKQNKILLEERYYEIDTEKITVVFDPENQSPVKLEHFTKVGLIKNIYLLYLAQNQFICIPVDSFHRVEDQKWFEDKIISEIRSRKS